MQNCLKSWMNIFALSDAIRGKCDYSIKNYAWEKSGEGDI